MKSSTKRMFNSVMTIIVYCLTCYQCDNSFNDRYNELVSSSSLKKSIQDELPKESKFFDMNDFDCEYIFHLYFSSSLMFDNKRIYYMYYSIAKAFMSCDYCEKK